MKYGKEYAKLKATFQNKVLEVNFNDKQECPKPSVDKSTFMEQPSWVCLSEKHADFVINTTEVVAYLHNKHKQDVKLQPTFLLKSRKHSLNSFKQNLEQFLMLKIPWVDRNKLLEKQFQNIHIHLWICYMYTEYVRISYSTG